ncbi:MAG TPA: tetratricopeptide repeat protein, partial [Gemmatirosa sp.]
LDRREWGAADDLLERARARSPQPAAVWYHYAILAARGMRDASRADRLAREGVAAHPREPALLANAAAQCAAAALRRDDAEALQGVMRAIAERPELAPAHRLLGELLYRAGQFDKARDAYAAATRVAPGESATAWARLGTLALRAGDRESARHAWERACSLRPDHPTARANLEALGRSGAAAPPVS